MLRWVNRPRTATIMADEGKSSSVRASLFRQVDGVMVTGSRTAGKAKYARCWSLVAGTKAKARTRPREIARNSTKRNRLSNHLASARRSAGTRPCPHDENIHAEPLQTEEPKRCRNVPIPVREDNRSWLVD